MALSKAPRSRGFGVFGLIRLAPQCDNSGFGRAACIGMQQNNSRNSCTRTGG